MKFIDIQQVCNLFHFRLMADNIGARLDDIGRGLCADKAAFLEIVLDLLCLGGVLFENLVDLPEQLLRGEQHVPAGAPGLDGVIKQEGKQHCGEDDKAELFSDHLFHPPASPFVSRVPQFLPFYYKR